MAIEIREVVIRANLEKKGDFRDEVRQRENLEQIKDEIISRCTEKVMEIMRNKLDR